MPIIIAVAILLFIFKGGIFKVFEWLFYGILAIFEFFVSIFDSIRTKRYQNQNEKVRQMRLKNIDKAYKEKDYQKVVSLYREVIKNRDYLNMETMKYCHIAADAVCHIAKTIPEYEEARTWTKIISFRDSYYEEEADALHYEITARGYETLKKQQELSILGAKYLEADEYDKTKEVLRQLADNGDVEALMALAEISVQSIDGFEAIDAAKALLDRLDAIEPNLSQQFRKSFNEHPIVKFKGYMKKATEYEKAAEKQKGIEYINAMLNVVKELEKAYDTIDMPHLIVGIAIKYQLIALEYMNGLSTSRHTFEKALEYAKIADEWIKKYEGEKDQEIEEIEKNIAEVIGLIEKTLNEQKQ